MRLMTGRQSAPYRKIKAIARPVMDANILSCPKSLDDLIWKKVQLSSQCFFYFSSS